MFKKHVDVAQRNMVLWATLVVGGWLDLMILEAFSDMNDSIFL